MSALVQGVVAGPTLKKFTPAPITSATALEPDGVIPSSGGPFASTIGNTSTPSRSRVPSWSRPVEPARAPPTSTDDATNASSHSRRLITPPRQDAAERAEGSSEAADRLGAVPRDAIDLDCPVLDVRAEVHTSGLPHRDQLCSPDHSQGPAQHRRAIEPDVVPHRDLECPSAGCTAGWIQVQSSTP